MPTGAGRCTSQGGQGSSPGHPPPAQAGRPVRVGAALLIRSRMTFTASLVSSGPRSAPSLGHRAHVRRVEVPGLGPGTHRRDLPGPALTPAGPAGGRDLVGSRHCRVGCPGHPCPPGQAPPPSRHHCPASPGRPGRPTPAMASARGDGWLVPPRTHDPQGGRRPHVNPAPDVGTHRLGCPLLVRPVSRRHRLPTLTRTVFGRRPSAAAGEGQAADADRPSLDATSARSTPPQRR